MNKIKSIVASEKSELVMLSKDGFPYSNVLVKEESVISNNLQSIFLILLRREDRNVKLIQLQHRTYIMDSANLETMLEFMFTKMTETKTEVLLETLFLADYDVQIHC